MAHQYSFVIAVLVAVFVVGVSSRPSNNEATTPLSIDDEVTENIDPVYKDERSLTFLEDSSEDVNNTKDIIEKIKAVNEALQVPKKRLPINYNIPQTGSGYILDKDILEKLQQIISSGKLNPLATINKYEDTQILNNDLDGQRNSRDMRLGLSQIPYNGGNQAMPAAPYITNLPVVIMPLTNNNVFGNSLNAVDNNFIYQTRQGPSLPFGIPWPLAPFFPILIKDPLLNVLSGGGFNNLFEYGQNADVCNRKQKSAEAIASEDPVEDDNNKIENGINQIATTLASRQARALKKRTIPNTSNLENNIENLKKVKKIFGAKPTTKKPVKSTYVEESSSQDTKTANHDEGDLRFPFFGDFTWFGNKKPVAPSPGFFINKLKVRRGGVAIAGPGGVATAGRGGTAIVGPGGLAYTQPGGLAVAGPSARVVAISSESDLSSIVSRLQEQSATDGSVPRLLEAIPEGKVVATGPVIFYHPTTQTYFRGAGWRGLQDGRWRQNSGFSRRSDEYQYNGASTVKGPWNAKDSFTLFLKPKAHAINSPRGVAIANPISNVVVSSNDYGSVVHTPVASAIVGPGGIAHAQSDLNLASVQYLPFYGGAKGQYLEVKRDNAGTITSEKIVSEDKISSENIFKNSNENLLSKVLAANLLSLKTTSSNLLRLHNIGRRTGSLANNDKTRFKSQLAALAEAASNTIKIVEEIGDDVDMLFKSNITQKKFDHDEYIEEEGVGIDAPEDDEPTIPLEGATIAEAKPVGLAVIGENGLASSRPIATAVASSGIALARPIATAIAGVDPVALGINFQVNQSKKSKH